MTLVSRGPVESALQLITRRSPRWGPPSKLQPARPGALRNPLAMKREGAGDLLEPCGHEASPFGSLSFSSVTLNISRAATCQTITPSGFIKPGDATEP